MMPIISSSSSRILLSLPDVKGNGLDYRVLNGPAGSARIKYGFSKAHRLQPLRMAASSSGSGPRLDVVDSLSPVPLMSSIRQPTVAAKKMQTVLIGLEPSTIQLGSMTRASSKPLEPVCTIGKTKSMSKKTSERSAKDLCPIDGLSVVPVTRRLRGRSPNVKSCTQIAPGAAMIIISPTKRDSLGNLETPLLTPCAPGYLSRANTEKSFSDSGFW